MTSRSSIPYNYTPIQLTAVLLATPDEQAVILALHAAKQLIGPGPKPLPVILAVLQALAQVYNPTGQHLQPMSASQAKRAIATLKARKWCSSHRDAFGGLGGYDLHVPDMEFEDAKDLLASRLSPSLVAKLGGDIKARVDRMAGKAPAYVAEPAPAAEPEQGDLALGTNEDQDKQQAQTDADMTERLAGIWAELFEKRYPGEKVLKATGAVWGYWNKFVVQDGVTEALFRAKVIAFLAQNDFYITEQRHKYTLLRTRWSQLEVATRQQVADTFEREF